VRENADFGPLSESDVSAIARLIVKHAVESTAPAPQPAWFDHDWISKARQIKEGKTDLHRADLLKSIAEAYAAAATPQVTPTDAAPAPQPPMDRLPLLVDAVQTFLKHDGGPGSEDYNASEIYHARRSMQAAFGFRCPRCGETLPHLYDENCTDYRAATPQVTPTKYSATGYSREELKAMHPTIDLEPEWVKCPQCGRENSKETWQKFGGKCPNCNDLFDKESKLEGTSGQASPTPDKCPTCKSPMRDFLMKKYADPANLTMCDDPWHSSAATQKGSK
jgi:rubrerythrin